MGLQGGKPGPALNNHGASADNKSLETPKQQLSDQDSSCGAGRDWWETHSDCRCSDPRLNPGADAWAAKERAVLRAASQKE